MSQPTVYNLKPAAADACHHARTKVRLCPFPASQARGQKRYLHPEGEVITCTTSEQRLWWLSMLRQGDVIKVDASACKGSAWSGPPPIDRGHENVPDLKDVGPAGGGGRKGGK